MARRKKQPPVEHGPMLRPRKVERPNKPKPKKKAKKALPRNSQQIVAPPGWFDESMPDDEAPVDWDKVPRGIFGVDPGQDQGSVIYAVALPSKEIRLPGVQSRPSPDRRRKAKKKVKKKAKKKAASAKANKNGRIYTKAAQKNAVKKPRESTRERRDRRIAEATAEPPTSFVVEAENIRPGDLIIGMPGGRVVSKVRTDKSGVTVYHKGRADSEALYFSLGSLWTVRRDG